MSKDILSNNIRALNEYYDAKGIIDGVTIIDEYYASKATHSALMYHAYKQYGGSVISFFQLQEKFAEELHKICRTSKDHGDHMEDFSGCLDVAAFDQDNIERWSDIINKEGSDQLKGAFRERRNHALQMLVPYETIDPIEIANKSYRQYITSPLDPKIWDLVMARGSEDDKFFIKEKLIENVKDALQSIKTRIDDPRSNDIDFNKYRCFAIAIKSQNNDALDAIARCENGKIISGFNKYRSMVEKTSGSSNERHLAQAKFATRPAMRAHALTKYLEHLDTDDAKAEAIAKYTVDYILLNARNNHIDQNSVVSLKATLSLTLQKTFNDTNHDRDHNNHQKTRDYLANNNNLADQIVAQALQNTHLITNDNRDNSISNYVTKTIAIVKNTVISAIMKLRGYDIHVNATEELSKTIKDLRSANVITRDKEYHGVRAATTQPIQRKSNTDSRFTGEI